MRLVISLLCLLLFCGGYLTLSHAASSRPEHSKDYKSFPKTSPEAVLTAFVEADLGDLYNRENDDRFPLWWGLTEQGGVPEDDGYLKLYITSYSVDRKANGKNSEKDVTLNLKLDVRAIWSSGNPKTSGSSWRDLSVYVGGVSYSSRSSRFVEDIFGSEVANKILAKAPDNYIVPINKRQWIFPVQMHKQRGKWVIATGSVPFPTAYLATYINSLKSEMDRERVSNAVCNGRRNIDKYVMEPYTQDVKEKIGTSVTNFRSKFCQENEIADREKYINLYFATIERLQRSSI